MKFYQVGSCFFPFKDEANKHRIDCGLPPSSLHTLSVVNRDDICALLNGMVGHALQPQFGATDKSIAEDGIPADVIPDYIPKFLHPKG